MSFDADLEPTTTGLNKDCQTQVLNALCSSCDGEIGTGQAKGLCQNVC